MKPESAAREQNPCLPDALTAPSPCLPLCRGPLDVELNPSNAPFLETATAQLPPALTSPFFTFTGLLRTRESLRKQDQVFRGVAVKPPVPHTAHELGAYASPSLALCRPCCIGHAMGSPPRKTPGRPSQTPWLGGQRRWASLSCGRAAEFSWPEAPGHPSKVLLLCSYLGPRLGAAAVDEQCHLTSPEPPARPHPHAGLLSCTREVTARSSTG